jgi:regulator of cell morphogenesis and NO signaling
MNIQSFSFPTVADMVTANYNRARVFERFGIDYCCGGKVSLAEACERAGVSTSEVEDALTAADQQADTTGAPSYADWSAAQLAEHITATHHAFVREEVPRLIDLFGHVAAKHGEQHPELIEAQNIFIRMSAELLNHMEHEERVLFPLCGAEPDPERNNSRWWLLDTLEHDHQDAGVDLARLRQLLYDYQPGPDLCRKRVALLHALAQFEQDMHVHVHKENSILFPRLRKSLGL